MYYHYKNDLKDCAGQVTAPVGIAEECPNQGEQINSSSPLANVIGSNGTFLTKNSS